VYVAQSSDEDYPTDHLWRPSLFTSVPEHVEKIRPVNTVPHFKLLHTCVTDESTTCFTMSSPTFWNTGTLTRIVGPWIYSKQNFDNGLYFDNELHFDLDAESFVADLTVWKISAVEVSGTKIDLTSSPVPTDLTNVIATGTVDKYTIYEDRVELEFEVSKSLVQNNINELGIYNSSGDLVIASTFADINKDDEVSLKVKVVVYRTRSGNIVIIDEDESYIILLEDGKEIAIEN